MTARQEELERQLICRFYPLKRLHLGRMEAMVSEEDHDLFDEEEYAQSASAVIRLDAIISSVLSRLPATDLSWADDEEVDTYQPEAVAA